MDWQRLMKLNAVLVNDTAIRIGLEREGQRVTNAGQLATTDLAPHLMARLPGLQRDFAETQLELVTAVQPHARAAWNALMKLTQAVRRGISPELIWPLSMPPTLPQDEHAIPIAKLDTAAVAYRQALAHRYGRRRQMLSGLHCNVSLSSQLLTALYRCQTDVMTFTEFQDQCYLHIAQNYLHYRWFLTYWYGCAPQCWPGAGQLQPLQAVRSIRNGPDGYQNRGGVNIAYDSLNHYCMTLQAAIRSGQLTAAKEFYGQVRLRGAAEPLKLRQTGIQYLELRNLDLNPWASAGITIAQLTFVAWFVLLMLWLPVPADITGWIQTGHKANTRVAMESPTQETDYLAEGLQLVAAMRALSTGVAQPAATAMANQMLMGLNEPTTTLAAQWQLRTQGSLEVGTQYALQLARRAEGRNC